jgi:restriction endonuclease S subunit
MSEPSILTIHKPTDDQLPQGWQQIALGEIVSLKSGFAYKSRDWQETGVPVIKIANVRAGKVTIEGCSHIDESIAAETVEFAVKESDILMTLTGEIGAIGVYREKFESRLNQRVARIDLHNTERTLLKYLIGFLESPEFRSEMWRLSKGMAQPNISPKQVVAISMGLPPLAEQERIVEILEEQLSRLDAALESVRVVREKAAQFRRSLLHAAFTGTLTGHNPTDGELPEGWRSGTLIDAAQVTMGQSPPGSSYNEIGDGEPFFQGKAEFGALHPTVRKWTTAGTRFAQNGDILMSVRAPVGPTNVADIDCVIGRGLAGIRAREHVDQTFLLWNLRHFEHEIAAKGTGTTFDSISGNDLKSQGLSIPPLAEQEQIVEILDEQLSRLDTALAVADAIEKCSAALRRSLLHAAFTGRLTEQWRESVHV